MAVDTRPLFCTRTYWFYNDDHIIQLYMNFGEFKTGASYNGLYVFRYRFAPGIYSYVPS